MNSFIESAAIDIGDGDQFTYIERVIPDLTFNGSTNLSSPQATFTVKAETFRAQVSTTPQPVTRSVRQALRLRRLQTSCTFVLVVVLSHCESSLRRWVQSGNWAVRALTCGQTGGASVIESDSTAEATRTAGRIYAAVYG